MNFDLNELSSEATELCEIIQPYSPSLSSVIRNFIHMPSDQRMLIAVHREAIRLKHKERIKILDTINELAHNDKLSDEMLRLFMIAFAG